MKALYNLKRFLIVVMALNGFVAFCGLMLVIGMISKGVDGHAINLVFYLSLFGIGGIEFLLSLAYENVKVAITATINTLTACANHSTVIEEELKEYRNKERFQKIISQTTVE